MWRISPVSKLVVLRQEQSRPTPARGVRKFGLHEHPRHAASGPIPNWRRAASTHCTPSLREIFFRWMSTALWCGKGSVDDDGLRFDGPVGLRSDNARFDFQYFAQDRRAALSPATRIGRSDFLLILTASVFVFLVFFNRYVLGNFLRRVRPKRFEVASRDDGTVRSPSSSRCITKAEPYRKPYSALSIRITRRLSSASSLSMIVRPTIVFCGLAWQPGIHQIEWRS